MIAYVFELNLILLSGYIHDHVNESRPLISGT